MKFSNENEIFIKNDQLDDDHNVNLDTQTIKADNSNDSQNQKAISMSKTNIVETVNTKNINKTDSKNIEKDLHSNEKPSKEQNKNEIRGKSACKTPVNSKNDELDGLIIQNLKVENKTAVETTQSLESENLDDSFTDLSFSELDDFNEDTNEIDSNLKLVYCTFKIRYSMQKLNL